jgi:hypothetical protein
MHVAETPTVDTSVAHVQLIVSLGPSMLQIVGLRCSWTWTPAAVGVRPGHGRRRCGRRDGLTVTQPWSGGRALESWRWRQRTAPVQSCRTSVTRVVLQAVNVLIWLLGYTFMFWLLGYTSSGEARAHYCWVQLNIFQ